MDRKHDLKEMIKDHIWDIGGSHDHSNIVDSSSMSRKKSSLGNISSESVLEKKPVIACSATQTLSLLSCTWSWEEGFWRPDVPLNDARRLMGWGRLERRRKALEPSGKHICTGVSSVSVVCLGRSDLSYIGTIEEAKNKRQEEKQRAGRQTKNATTEVEQPS
jgi:hypothetical protein